MLAREAASLGGVPLAILVAVLASIAGCGKQTSEPGTSGSAGATASGSNAPEDAPQSSSLPAGRDPEAAKLVKAGASCPLKDDEIELSCPAREAAGEYAFQHQQSVEVAATCAELLRDPDPSTKLVAAHCLERLTAVAVTPVLGAGLDALEAEPDAKLRRSIAWGLKDAEAVTAKLEARVLALVDRLAKSPEDEDAAGSVLDTLFPEYVVGSGPKPPPAAQAVVLAAFDRRRGGLFIRACDLVRLVEDKAAACRAVAGAIVPDSPEWWRALAALNDLGAPCAGAAPAALEVALANYRKGNIDAPQEMERFARVFELTPKLREQAAASLVAAKKTAPAWKRKALDDAAAELSKPWSPPT